MSTTPRRTLKKRHLVEFLQFGIVGGSGVIVNFAVFYALKKITGVDEHQIRDILFPLWPTPKNFRLYHLFAMVAFLIANVWNFEINRRWTFGKGGRASKRRFARFFAVGLAAQLLGLVIMSALMSPGSVIGLPRDILDGSTGLRTPSYWAQAIQVLCTTPISFVLQKLWTFTGNGPGSRPTPVEPERLTTAG
ncbi:MAG: GtrA family protein [Dermatophilaceae bacterium]